MVAEIVRPKFVQAGKISADLLGNLVLSEILIHAITGLYSVMYPLPHLDRVTNNKDQSVPTCRAPL